MLIHGGLYVLATAAALFGMSEFFGELGVYVSSFYVALIVAIIWGVLGFTVRPILTILTLPINLLTFGLFSFVINALLFWFLSSFIEGFNVDGFVPALLGSLILSAVSWVLHRSR